MLLGLSAGLTGVTGAAAAELKILAPRAIWTVLNEIGRSSSAAPATD
jgi:hypothetical protein